MVGSTPKTLAAFPLCMYSYVNTLGKLAANFWVSETVFKGCLKYKFPVDIQK